MIPLWLAVTPDLLRTNKTVRDNRGYEIPKMVSNFFLFFFFRSELKQNVLTDTVSRTKKTYIVLAYMIGQLLRRKM